MYVLMNGFMRVFFYCYFYYVLIASGQTELDVFSKEEKLANS